MTNRNVVAVAAAMVFLTVASTVGQGQNRDRLVQEFLEAIPPDTVTDAEVYEMNGFRVESAQVKELDAALTHDGNEMQLLSVTAADVFKVTIEKGRPMSAGGGVGIFHRKAGTPMLAVADGNNDGRIDSLEYSVLGIDGETLLTVVDYEADGQSDLRISFENGYFEIWHIDRWYRAETRNGRPGIVIEGEFVELKRGDNRWIVP